MQQLRRHHDSHGREGRVEVLLERVPAFDSLHCLVARTRTGSGSVNFRSIIFGHFDRSSLFDTFDLERPTAEWPGWPPVSVKL